VGEPRGRQLGPAAGPAGSAQRPKAFVKLGAGQNATEQEIIDFCRQNLSHFKAPAAVEFTDLPKTSTGKIQKYVLREQGWGGYQKRVN
jgi:fatty-acyl-CoA synthase